MSDLPSNWSECLLGDVVNKITSGGTPKADNPLFYGGDIPFLKIDDVTASYKYLRSHKTTITELGLKESSAKIVPAGTLLLTMYGTIGKCCITTYPVTTNQGIACFLDHPRIDLNYLYYCLSEKASDFNIASSQTTQANISATILKQTTIALPPLPEQKKIAEILSFSSKLINLLDIEIEKLKILKESIKSQYFLHQSHSDIQIKKLKDICCIRQGLQIPKANRSNTNGVNKLPYLTTSWINSNFAISKAEYIESPKDSVILKEDEFVVGRTGAVGKIFDGLCCVFHNNFFAVSPKESVCKKYLMYYLTWNVIQDEILKRAGTTTIPDLNHSDFYSINIPLPSIEKQINIISKIDSINKLISVKKSSKTKMQLIHKGLSNDLLSGRKRVNV